MHMNKGSKRQGVRRQRGGSEPKPAIPQQEIGGSGFQNDNTEFLLTEFGELGQFWRHTDARIENGINYYLTASAAVTSVIAFGSQQLNDGRLFAGFVILVLGALFVGGDILIRRIVSTALIKAEYAMALNRIRGYFADRDSEMARYLVLPIASSPTEGNEASRQDFKVRMPGYILRALRLWTGGLLGLAVGILSWIIEPRLHFASLIAIGVAAGAACFGFLTWATQKQVAGYKERLARRR